MPTAKTTPKLIRNRRLATFLFKLDWGLHNAVDTVCVGTVHRLVRTLERLGASEAAVRNVNWQATGVCLWLTRNSGWSARLIDRGLYCDLLEIPLEERD